jgi:hypothetical protein
VEVDLPPEAEKAVDAPPSEATPIPLKSEPGEPHPMRVAHSGNNEITHDFEIISCSAPKARQTQRIIKVNYLLKPLWNSNIIR